VRKVPLTPPGRDADIGIMSVPAATADIPRSSSYVSAIARIHKGFEAERALAGSLNGRMVAVRGCTIEEWVELKPLVESCGADVVRVLLPEVSALVIGSRIMPADITAAQDRGMALLRRHDIAVIASIRERVRDREKRATREAVDRALGDARKAVLEKEQHRVEHVAEKDRASGLHVRLRDER
jgi:hypothetical protein